MNNKNNCYKCERCGSDCSYFRKGATQGWKCKNCDFEIVTSYMPFSDIPTEFEITLKPNTHLTSEGYKYLSKLLELNYLQLKARIGNSDFTVKKDLYGTLNVMEKLDELGIKHHETPEYPYSPDDEMYYKIKTNTVFEDDFVEE